MTNSPLIEALHGVGKEQRTGKILTDDTLNILVNRASSKLGGPFSIPKSIPLSPPSLRRRSWRRCRTSLR